MRVAARLQILSQMNTIASAVIAVLIVGVNLSVYAQPSDLANYAIVSGGRVNIEPGAYVEGSTVSGGMQPEYFVDTHIEPLKSLLVIAAEIGRGDLPYWSKVEAVLRLVNQGYYRHRSYSNPSYIDLMRQYRERQAPVPLSAYGECGAGVCREFNMTLHIALKAAGLPNEYVYAKVQQVDDEPEDEPEDHAFVVVVHDGEEWTVDAYNWAFNGYKLESLLSPRGVRRGEQAAPIASTDWYFRRIVRVNSYPTVYNPQKADCDLKLMAE